MSDSATNSPPGFARASAPRRAFHEKSFYLEEFYGKSLLFAMVPPGGDRISDFDSLVRTLRELRRNQTRCIVIVSPTALPKLLKRLGRMAPSEARSRSSIRRRGCARVLIRPIPPLRRSGRGCAPARSWSPRPTTTTPPIWRCSRRSSQAACACSS